jgi:hypothetical protein
VEKQKIYATGYPSNSFLVAVPELLVMSQSNHIEGPHKTQQDIRPRWGRSITTLLKQFYTIPMESMYPFK